MNDFERDLARHLMKCELEYRAKKQAESSCVDWLVPYCNSINDIVAFLHSLGFRIARIVDDVEEKMKAMSILMRTQTGKEFEFNDRLVSIVAVIRIDVTEFTAKHRPIPEKLR